MAQAALCDITPQTRIPTLLIAFCVHVLLLVGRCEFRPNIARITGPQTSYRAELQPPAMLTLKPRHPVPDLCHSLEGNGGDETAGDAETGDLLQVVGSRCK